MVMVRVRFGDSVAVERRTFLDEIETGRIPDDESARSADSIEVTLPRAPSARGTSDGSSPTSGFSKFPVAMSAIGASAADTARASPFARELWTSVRDAFRATNGPAIADLWLSQVQPIAFTKGVFTIAVPNDLVRDWLESKYRQQIESIFQDLTGSPVRVLFRHEAMLPVTARDMQAERGQSDENRAAPFVVRPENRLAHAALLRQLADPSTGNPLFIYGPSGVGKTVLVRHHLERYAEQLGGPRATVSVNAEAFSQDLVAALKDNELSAFRGRMLAADVFVLEEAHRLRGKPRTQREFLSILRYHVERGRPVILTSRHPPNGIFLLDEALRSYFLSGILVRIPEYPDPSRVAILAELSKRHARPMPIETIERVVARVPGSFDRQVRFLDKVAAFAALSNSDATLEFLSARFPELSGQPGIELDIKSLIELTAREFGTSAEEVASNCKVRTAVLARHVVVYVATLVFNMKANRVMRHLGGLSPSTTAYARRRVEEMRRKDPMFDSRIHQLLDRLQRGQKLLF